MQPKGNPQNFSLFQSLPQNLTRCTAGQFHLFTAGYSDSEEYTDLSAQDFICKSLHRALKYIKKHEALFSQMKFIALIHEDRLLQNILGEFGQFNTQFTNQYTQPAYGNFQHIEMCFKFSLPMVGTHRYSGRYSISSRM